MGWARHQEPRSAVRDVHDAYDTHNAIAIRNFAGKRLFREQGEESEIVGSAEPADDD